MFPVNFETFQKVIRIKPDLSFNKAVFIATMLETIHMQVTEENVQAVIDSMNELRKESA